LWGSSVLDAALWFRRSDLWSITYCTSGSGLSPIHYQSSLPFLCLFTDSSTLRLAPCPSPFLWCSFSIPPPTVHVWL
jgi:hypothetical protein